MTAEQSPVELEPIFISAKQAAAMLNLNLATIYLLIGGGEIEARYMGRRHLVFLNSVREYAKNLPLYPAGGVS